MFIAKPACEAPVMAALGRTDGRYFWAVELSIRLPWFIVNAIVQHGTERYIKSICCAWEQDLAALCEPTDGRTVASIQQLAPTDGVLGGWAVRQVVKVWRAPHSNGHNYLVLKDDRGDEWSGEFGSAPPDGLGERELLFSLEPRRRRRGMRRKSAQEPLGHGVPLHAQAADIMSTVEADELGRYMGGFSAGHVSQLEARGELFSVVDKNAPGRRRYPLYQVWPTIPRLAFTEVLAVLRANGGTGSPHFFFAYPDQDLGSLTPVEVLLGAIVVERELHKDAPMLLAANAEDRRQFVLAAAKLYAAADTV